MLSQLESYRPGLEPSEVAINRKVALELWDQRGVFVDANVFAREITELLNEIAQKNQDWDQDSRDATLSLVQVLADRSDHLPLLSAEHQVSVGRAYIKIVEALSPDADWLGPPWTAMELGRNIAAILGKEIDFVEGMRMRAQLAEVWSNYAAQVSFAKADSKQPHLERKMFDESFRPLLGKLQAEFLDRPNGISQQESQRIGPKLKKPYSEMAIWFAQAARDGASAKLQLLRAVPEYIDSLTSRGIDIADFWNLNDSEQVSKMLDEVLMDPLTKRLFETRFEAKTGNSFDRIDQKEKRALADLNFNLVRDIYVEIAAKRTNFEDVYGRILNQIEQAGAMGDPKPKLRPIVNWLRQIEPGFNCYNSAEIKKFIDSHQSELKAHHENRFSGVDAALETIADNLPIQSGRVQFMERGLYDLKSANLTADCTAWNLDLGFNAWTLPAWLTNPGFNFAYITHGNAMVAKFGMILAMDDQNKPQVIIDSIETNKNLHNVHKSDALGAIYAGFAEIQKWADRKGFGTLKVCTYTNSQELTANLPIVKDSAPAERQLVFDGLVASHELIAKNSFDQSQEPALYLQSAEVDAWGDPELAEVYERGEYVSGAETFEALATKALAASQFGRTEEQVEEFLSGMRSGDKDEIFMALIDALCPKFIDAFSVELDYDILHKFYFNCLKEAKTRRISIESIFMEALENLAMRVAYGLEDRQNIDLKKQERDSRFEEESEYWAWYDDADVFEEHLEMLIEEQDSESRLKRYGAESQESFVRSELVPASMIPENDGSYFDEMMTSLRDAGQGQEQYEHILEVLQIIFGDDPDRPDIDIVRSAKYVFGTASIRQQSSEPDEGSGPTIRLHNDLSEYDRRELAAYPD